MKPRLREPFARFVESELGADTLLITCGLPGTWKTETSEEISRIKGYPILRSDVIRLDVLRGDNIFDDKVASDMSKRTAVYDETFRRADVLLEKADSVILDATFITQTLRRQAAAIAAKYSKRLVILETHCPQEVAIARILRRTAEDYVSNALTERAYLNNRSSFEDMDVSDLKRAYPGLDITHLVVDTKYDAPEDWYVIGKEER
jgi:hypothetical protein